MRTTARLALLLCVASVASVSQVSAQASTNASWIPPCDESCSTSYTWDLENTVYGCAKVAPGTGQGIHCITGSMEGSCSVQANCTVGGVLVVILEGGTESFAQVELRECSDNGSVAEGEEVGGMSVMDNDGSTA